MTQTLLSIHHATKTYNGIPALIDASLELYSGKVHALMGENGAGKSTLIKILAGVVAPDEAQIEVQGVPVVINSPQAAFEHGLRFIHQELNVVPQLSAAENLFLGQRYPTRFGVMVRWGRLNQMAREVLSQLDITHIDPRQTMARLSPGDQMLVNIAHAFVGDDLSASAANLIYVMDEPTAALTGQETEQLFRVIETLRDRGNAVLYVSHRMDEIFRIANRVTVMRDGQVVNTQAIDDVTPADLIYQMTGRELSQVYPPRTAPHSDEILLDVRELQTAYVRDVTFQLHRGEIIGIAGLSGAGRTEVLRGLMGADKVIAGEIVLEGKGMRGFSPARAWGSRIAYVPEERRSQGLILSRSVGNNVTLPQLRYLSRGGALLAHRVERQTSRQLGDSVGLKAKGPAQTVRQLSGGNQQKVVFARALVQPPKVLLLDEPTRGVDVGAKADLYVLIREISAQGTGIVMVSSDLPELLGLTDRILIMRNGQMIEIVPTAGLTQARLLALCYGEMNADGNP